MDQPRTNPLSVFALVAGFSLVMDIYHVVQTHQIAWLVVLRSALAIPFLALYLLKLRAAWLFVMASIVLIYPVYFLVLYFTQPSRLPSLTVALIMGLFYFGGIAYVFSVRARYYSFLDSSAEISSD